MCRDHRCLTVCQKQQRQHEPAVEVDVPTVVEVQVRAIPDTCRDLRRLTTCQKQYRQNEPAGRLNIPTGVEVRVTGVSQTSVGTTNISPLVSLEIHVMGIWTHLGTTDVSQSVKNNTDRMNQLVG